MPMPPERKRDMGKRAKQHEIAAGFLRNPRISRALDELHDSQEARDEMEQNPDEFLRRRHIRLPEGADVVFEQFSPAFSIDVGIGDWHAGYNETDGFYAGKEA
jgi:hypothetical protein